MTVHDDLTTLRRDNAHRPWRLALLDRVEAEIARLEDADAAIEAAEASVRKHERHVDTLLARAVAAEAEAARLRDGLREIRDELRPVMTYDGGTNTSRYGYEASQRARALLAEDGAA